MKKRRVNFIHSHTKVVEWHTRHRFPHATSMRFLVIILNSVAVFISGWVLLSVERRDEPLIPVVKAQHVQSEIKWLEYTPMWPHRPASIPGAFLSGHSQQLTSFREFPQAPCWCIIKMRSQWSNRVWWKRPPYTHLFVIDEGAIRRRGWKKEIY